MHLHSGALEALLIFAQVVTIGFFWRVLAAYFVDKPGGLAALGRAMAVVY